MKDIKLIVTDLDMTLLHSDQSISDYSQRVFSKCSDYGIKTAIATARYWIGAEKYIDLIKPDFAITTDGTMIQHDNRLFYGYGLEPEIANKIIVAIKNIDKSLEISVATEMNVFWNSLHISDSPKLYKAIYNDFSKPFDSIVYKIVAQLPDKETANNLASDFPECRLVSYRDENLYGFIRKDAGKIQAIKALVNSLNFDLSNVIAFGDDHNDLEMLKQCGYSVAVSNAIKEIREIVDTVTQSNDEDGVAKYIEKNLFG